MHKNVFISQPMTGLCEEEILATRKKEEEKIYKFFDNIEVNVIDSYIDDKTRDAFQGYRHMTNIINWDVYWISHSLQKLAMADVLWLCDDWEYSKGCEVELMCAELYDIDVIYPEERR